MKIARNTTTIDSDEDPSIQPFLVPQLSTDRRNFLKATAAGVAGVSMASSMSPAADRASAPRAGKAIPPHRPLPLPGIHAYAEKTVEAGDTVHFRVSSTVPYELAVCRLGDVDDRNTDVVLHREQNSVPTQQPIHPGSYVHIEKGLSAGSVLEDFSVELWVRPWKLNARQALITQFDAPRACAFGLWMGIGGAIEFYLGDGGAFKDAWMHTAGKLNLDRWQHIVATRSGKSKSLWVDGSLAGIWQSDSSFSGAAAPLRLAAAGQNGVADEFLDGDLAMPVLYGRALDENEVRARYEQHGLQPPTDPDILGCWILREERGDHIADASDHGRNGQIINHATWMIGGPTFDASAVERYANYSPASDARRGHALRFASDDLYDCRWDTVHEFTIPASAQQGLYTGRLRYEQNSDKQDYHVAFVVRKPAKQAKAPMLVLTASNTWLAYSATPFAANGPSSQNWGTFGLTNPPGSPPAYSCYRDHHAGQPAYQFGLNMPWPVAGPDVLYSPPGVGYSHLMRGERFTHTWLDKAGYEYDLATDFDLESNPNLLDDYQVLVINGHSEYWSRPAYKAVEQFLGRGGHLLVLSGNTMFWRVSFDDQRQVMECRKHDPTVGASKRAPLGEIWHSHDGQRGALMREAGLPAWALVGLEFLGWWSMGFDYFGVYKPAATDHFLWHEPNEVELTPGETFGHAAGGREPRAVGHEADVRLTTMKRMANQPVPMGATMPEEPAGITTLAVGTREATDGTAFDYFGRPTKAVDKIFGEMIFWDRPEGGKVFNAGAIGAGWALGVDPKMQTLLGNVLHHFGLRPHKASSGKT